MTAFEFYKAQLDEAVEKGLTQRVNPEIKSGTLKWVQVCADWFFGGAWDYQMREVTDIAELREQKLLKVMEYSNWRARQLGQTRKIALTNKGVREFYKVMIKIQG